MTVQISNRQPFDISPQTYWRDIWLSLPFLQRLYCEVLGFKAVELLEQQGDLESGLKRRLRMYKPVQGPAAVQKVFGSVMTMDEESEFQPKAQRWTYRMVPSRLADRMDVHGSITLAMRDGGIEQISEDSLSFKMLGVSAVIEPFMARETKQGHVDRTSFTQRYITEHKLR